MHLSPEGNTRAYRAKDKKMKLKKKKLERYLNICTERGRGREEQSIVRTGDGLNVNSPVLSLL